MNRADPLTYQFFSIYITVLHNPRLVKFPEVELQIWRAVKFTSNFLVQGGLASLTPKMFKGQLYLYSIYIGLGVIGNLEMIYNIWEDVCRLHANTTPFNLTYLSILGFWSPWEILELIPYGYRGMTVYSS